MINLRKFTLIFLSRMVFVSHRLHRLLRFFFFFGFACFRRCLKRRSADLHRFFIAARFFSPTNVFCLSRNSQLVEIVNPSPVGTEYYRQGCKPLIGCYISIINPGGVDVLMSAGNPSASSGITLRLLLRVSPLGTSLLCFIVYL